MINTRELCGDFGNMPECVSSETEKEGKRERERNKEREEANLLGDVNFVSRNVVFIFSKWRCYLAGAILLGEQENKMERRLKCALFKTIYILFLSCPARFNTGYLSCSAFFSFLKPTSFGPSRVLRHLWYYLEQEMTYIKIYHNIFIIYSLKNIFISHI